MGVLIDINEEIALCLRLDAIKMKSILDGDLPYNPEAFGRGNAQIIHLDLERKRTF